MADTDETNPTGNGAAADGQAPGTEEAPPAEDIRADGGGNGTPQGEEPEVAVESEEAAAEDGDEPKEDKISAEAACDDGANTDTPVAVADGDDGVVEAAAIDADESVTTQEVKEESEHSDQSEEEQEQHEQQQEQEHEPEVQHAEAEAEQEQTAEQKDTGKEAEVNEEQAPAKTPSVLSEEERARCHKLFDRKAFDGRLDLRGFKVLFRLLGQVLSAQDAQDIFEDADRSDDSTIDIDEFFRLYAKFSEAEQARKDAMLDSIDKLFPGHNGKPVELKKVERLLLKLQQPDLDMRLVREKSDLNANDITNLVSAMDKNGSGYISKQEFVDTLTRHLDVGV